MSEIKFPVAIPDLGGNEVKYTKDAVESSWISSMGVYVDKFEEDFSALCSVQQTYSVCNGTIALHLALLALDVRPGDEVLVPSLTYIATANAVRYVGAEPVFIDVDPDTWCIDPILLENSITIRTKGIIAVHLYGHPADMDAINHIAAVHGLWVVEDAAEAHFAKYKNRPVGGLAKIGTFSFYGNKIITCGEGGALTLNDPGLALRIKTLRGQGMDPDRRYYFPVLGYNFRLTNVACALLCAQIERHGKIIASRNHIFSLYRDKLSGISGLTFQPVADWAESAPWLFCIVIEEKKFGIARSALVDILTTNGVDTRPFFLPVHSLPPYREEHGKRGTHLPVTEKLSAAGLNLPTYHSLSLENIEFIANLIRTAGA